MSTENNGAIQLSIVKGVESGQLDLDNTGIPVIAEDMTYEQFKEALRFVKWAKKRADLGLASLIAFGNAKFGPDKVNQALEQLEFEATMVKTAVAINSIPPELRFDNLDSQHYVELAKAQPEITKKQLIHWARVASEQRLTPTQLRLSIIEGEVIDVAATRALVHGVVTIHAMRQQFDVWFLRVGGMAGVLEMDEDSQEEILGELSALVNFSNQLKERMEAIPE